jgi:prepilin-type N-terminal cleavage/methylation domain-containing protein
MSIKVNRISPLSAVTFVNKGFSLLELLLVVSLLGMLALATTAMVDNTDDQQRFELTRTRLQQIKTAMIGDTSRTLNGEPMISGFVADMGRLPNCLKELLVKEDCDPSTPLPLADWTLLYFDGVDTSVPASSVGQLRGGWRGPYLETMPETTGYAFRDGWANPNSGVPDNDYGWRFSLAASAVSLQSLGKDGAEVGSDYAADYPDDANKEIFGPDNWTVSLSGVSFQVRVVGIPDVDAPEGPGLKLRLFYIKDSVIEPLISDSDFSPVSGVPSQTFPITFGGGADSVPIGKYAAVVVCPDNTLYDGDCTSPSTTPYSTYYFTLTPRAVLPIEIPWNIN